jgi:hypothetical protein
MGSLKRGGAGRCQVASQTRSGVTGGCSPGATDRTRHLALLGRRRRAATGGRTAHTLKPAPVGRRLRGSRGRVSSAARGTSPPRVAAEEAPRAAEKRVKGRKPLRSGRPRAMEYGVGCACARNQHQGTGRSHCRSATASIRVTRRWVRAAPCPTLRKVRWRATEGRAVSFRLLPGACGPPGTSR